MSDLSNLTTIPDDEAIDLTGTELEPGHVAVSQNPFTIANAKKAYTAGIAGAVTAAGGLSLGAVFTGGTIDTNTLLADAGIVIGGFVLAFFGAWLPRNS
jgi:hypothetical protein